MLNSEYPAPAPKTVNILIALVFGLFISLFLLFFEPFDIDVENHKNSITSLFIFGLITAVVLIIFLFLFPLLFPKVFSDSHWKVKHQMIFFSIILLIIATLNGIYTNYLNTLAFSWKNYWWIINRTFVLGAIPFSFLIVLDYHRKKQSNIKEALFILEKKERMKKLQDFTTINVVTDLKNEKFSFNSNHFYYAKAVGNYIDFFYSENGETLDRNTYRITLSSFQKQLQTENLKRCHRSYLVNVNKIIDLSGNAQGLKLTLSLNSTLVPVSRKYIPEIKKFLKQLDFEN